MQSQCLSCEDSVLVEVIENLAKPIHHIHPNQNSFLGQPDYTYVLDIENRLKNLIERFSSLNVVYYMLSLNELPIVTNQGNIARHEWLRIILDVLLARFSSVRDSAFLLISAIFELTLNPHQLSEKNLEDRLENRREDLHQFIHALGEHVHDFRNEDNVHFQHGEERILGDDTVTFFSASIWEAIWTQKPEGKDRSGKPFDIDKSYQQIVDGITTEFTREAHEIEEELSGLFEKLYIEFLKRFREKLHTSTSSVDLAEQLIKSGEAHNKELHHSV